jgi:formate dehydrogenase subunit beta
MPNNAAKMLSCITANGPANEPVAAVLRPCELRAFVEVGKRRQADPTNIITICPTCTGVLPLKRLMQDNEERLVNDYWAAVGGTEPIADTRDACKRCEHFVPENADFIVSMAGRKNCDKECVIIPDTERAISLCEGMEAMREEDEVETAHLHSLRENRRKARQEQNRELEKKASGLSGLVSIFASCVNCRACRTVCPICYCIRCEFDAPRWEPTPDGIKAGARKRGGVRLPSGTLNFQLGRLLHMGISCVECGMCSDVCPAAIPVSEIFSNAGCSTQELFDYVPGRNAEEKVPLTVFREKELEEVEH